MFGYQIRTMTQKMFQVSEFIRKKQWAELSNAVELECTPEEIEFEVGEYPCELSECEISDFFDGALFEAIDGFRITAVADFWAGGEESDLSMEFKFTFRGKELEKAILRSVHVF